MINTKIAVVQMQAIIGDIDRNLHKIADYCIKASQENVSIICFPELSIHGYSRERAHEFAEVIPGFSSQYLVKVAIENNITIIAGFIEKAHKSLPYITQIIVFPDGKIKKYRKTHLGGLEKKYFSSGDNLPVFEANYNKFAIEICWDLHFPEVSTILSLNGAEIIFAPHASPDTGIDRKAIWLKYLPARAYDNTVYIAACNLVGYDGEKQDMCGGALILDPKGNVIAEAFNGKEEMLIAELDAELINKVRQKESKSMRHIFYLESRRPELYGEIVGSELIVDDLQLTAEKNKDWF